MAALVLLVAFIAKAKILSIIFTVINVILAIVELSDTKNIDGLYKVEKGSGYILLLIGSIVITIASITLLVTKKKKRV